MAALLIPASAVDDLATSFDVGSVSYDFLSTFPFAVDNGYGVEYPATISFNYAGSPTRVEFEPHFVGNLKKAYLTFYNSKFPDVLPSVTLENDGHSFPGVYTGGHFTPAGIMQIEFDLSSFPFKSDKTSYLVFNDLGAQGYINVSEFYGIYDNQFPIEEVSVTARYCEITSDGAGHSAKTISYSYRDTAKKIPFDYNVYVAGLATAKMTNADIFVDIGFYPGWQNNSENLLLYVNSTDICNCTAYLVDGSGNQISTLDTSAVSGSVLSDTKTQGNYDNEIYGQLFRVNCKGVDLSTHRDYKIRVAFFCESVPDGNNTNHRSVTFELRSAWMQNDGVDISPEAIMSCFLQKKFELLFTKLDQLVESAAPAPVDSSVTSSMDQAGSDLADVGAGLDSVSRPDLGGVNTDLNSLVPSGGFSSASKFFSHCLGKSSILQFLILTITFALVGYLFYGKK